MGHVSHTILIMMFIVFTRNVSANPGAVSGRDGLAARSDQRKTDVRTSLGYWNDNFVFNTPFDQRSGKGRDDFHTASFWFQITMERPEAR